mmetsp:Transcript_9243/g.27244  ORF Transcript_9243/g.27244 Transcript_9243/m.27244 type:complete len:335 (+) Transcript_9243:298-1302(+)
MKARPHAGSASTAARRPSSPSSLVIAPRMLSSGKRSASRACDHAVAAAAPRRQSTSTRSAAVILSTDMTRWCCTPYAGWYACGAPPAGGSLSPLTTTSARARTAGWSPSSLLAASCVSLASSFATAGATTVSGSKRAEFLEMVPAAATSSVSTAPGAPEGRVANWKAEPAITAWHWFRTVSTVARLLADIGATGGGRCGYPGWLLLLAAPVELSPATTASARRLTAWPALSASTAPAALLPSSRRSSSRAGAMASRRPKRFGLPAIAPAALSSVSCGASRTISGSAILSVARPSRALAPWNDLASPGTSAEIKSAHWLPNSAEVFNSSTSIQCA